MPAIQYGLAVFILILVLIALCAFVLAVIYFVRAPGNERGAILWFATEFLVTCALGVWMILGRDHLAVGGLAVICVSG
jgi:hypothetical protein